jgi:hypothetical protein
VARVAALVIGLVAWALAGAWPTQLEAQSEEAHAAETLDMLESVLGWPDPDPGLATDVRVMTRSALAIAPLPLVRLTGGDDDRVVATVTEWGHAEVSRVDSTPLFFRYLPLSCAGDQSICAGTPRTIRSPEAKALWFALFLARSCNDRPRKTVSDAEDLFVRGRVRGIPMTFSCRGPNPHGATP